MADSMSISYKVYLEDSTDTTEVRRFGIDRSLAFKFSFLREKLQNVFPSLQNRDFTISWKDQEGDIIMISSDEELTLALSEMNTDVRKLYVAVKSEENLVPDVEMPEMGQPAEGPAVHEGVTCDGCNKPIIGFRYKCAVCPDFDLCSACESLGMHDDHFMIRISKPIKWRSAYSRRLAHHMAKWSRLSESHRHHHQRRNVKCAAGQQGNERNPQCMYNRSYSEHPGWLEYLCNQLGEWVNLPGEFEIPMKAGNTATTSGNSPAPGETPKPSSASEGAKGTQESETPRNSNQPRDLTYLQNVGETVAALLSPLGIDVEIQVKDKNQKQVAENREAPQASAQAKETEQTAQPRDAEMAEAKEMVKTVQPREAEMAAEKEMVKTVQPREAEMPVAKEMVKTVQPREAEMAVAKEMVKTVQPKEAEMAAAKEMVKTVEPREKEMSAVASVSEPMEVSSETSSDPLDCYPYEPEEGWTYLVPDNVGSPNPRASKALDEILAKFDDKSYDSIYPSVDRPTSTRRQCDLYTLQKDNVGSPNPRASKALDEILAKFDDKSYNPIYPSVDLPMSARRQFELHSLPKDPKILKTLKQLLAMGFTNDGGWLVQLIKLKDGDIDRVLDVLLPAKK